LDKSIKYDGKRQSLPVKCLHDRIIRHAYGLFMRNCEPADKRFSQEEVFRF
jgi:hypothetical protein